MMESHRSDSESESGMMMKPQPVKRLCKSKSSTSVGLELDRISELPDSILEHILSFLEVEDAIKTSFLSKRWRYLWTGVPVLNFFNTSNVLGSIEKFYTFVDQTLANYRRKKIEKLHISCNYKNYESSRVDKWIRFAAERNVEELLLQFDAYQLPQFIYSNSSLRILKTNLCYVKVSGCVSWTSLKVLSMYFPNLDNEDMEKILLGSPKLEYLELGFCFNLHKIAVMSSNYNLKKLVVNSTLQEKDLEISAPNIHSLSLLTCIETIKFGNLSSLVELELCLGRWEDKYPSLARLLEKLHHVQKLTIQSEFSGILSICKPLKCKSLTLKTTLDERDFQGIASFLQSSPHLEELTINMFPAWIKYDDDTECWEPTKTNIRFDHLKTVEIDTGFGPMGTRLKFFSSILKFLLANAMVLEKIVIYTLLEGVDKLIERFPRASANVLGLDLVLFS